MTTPADVFSELRENAPREEGRAYRAFYGPANLWIRVFIDGDTRIPGFILKTTRAFVPAGMSIPRIRGAKSTISQGGGEGNKAEVLYEISASENAYVDVFMELAARLIDDCIEAPTAAQALLEVSRRVAAWARFFDARGEDGLGRSAQLGLIGELLCLERLASLVNLDWAVEAWTGPTGSPHDFQAEGGAIEVKLSTTSSPERFRITSERQLDDSVIPWLGLYAITAQEVRAGGEGLESIVTRLRAAMQEKSPGTSSALERRLMECGYSDSDKSRYTLRVKVRESEFLHVRDEFPRVRPSELRPNVFALSYEIPWDAIVPFRVPESDVRRVFVARN